MGRGFVGLTWVLSWVGSGSLGRAHSRARWVGLGCECSKPGLPSEPDEGFTL